MLALLNMIGGKTLLYAAGGLALLLALAWVERRIEEVGSLRAAVATERQVNRQNAAELAKLRADSERAAGALAAALAQEHRRSDEQASLSQEIDHAPTADRGPVPRVILRALDGLLGGASAADGANQGSAPTRAGGAPRLPAGAVAPTR